LARKTGTNWIGRKLARKTGTNWIGRKLAREAGIKLDWQEVG
jgi:hypothetical protein